MNLKSVLSFVSPLIFASTTLQAESIEHPEWQRYFDEASVPGTILIVDDRDGATTTHIYNTERAAKHVSPASTFKIPHALFALDAGVVADEFEVIKWDGEERRIAAWNADQTLRSSIRNSTVWVYERYAEQIGFEREKSYMQSIDYGNAATTGNSPFWVEGDLAITPHEQLRFLRKLYRNELPFKIEHQRLVKDLIIVEAGRDYIVRAKTGWSGIIGWWTGWVEHPAGAVFFALNIDTPNRLEDLPARQSITRKILESLNALPTETK